MFVKIQQEIFFALLHLQPRLGKEELDSDCSAHRGDWAQPFSSWCPSSVERNRGRAKTNALNGVKVALSPEASMNVFDRG
mmetsp:Transcript_70520/g.146856  ORF Transcript_70520/g.146856 Transcript_70520/m.146856 type:complete len:80 (+) Transcript_70520:442-681(+)